MALCQESLIELGIESRPVNRRRRVNLSSRKASIGDLARVELPLLAVLSLFFIITIFVSPSLEISTLGVDLPELVLCPLLALTGIPCLMCGITRSFLSMGGMDVTSSFVFHPLGPVFFLALVGLFVTCAYSLVARRQLRVTLDKAFSKGLLRAGTVIILAAWLVKVVIWSQVGLL